MRRVTLPPRRDWEARLHSVAIDWGGVNQGSDSYWQDGAAYEFSETEILRLERVSQSLIHALMDTLGHAISERRLGELGVPAFLHAALSESWARRDPAVYLRLDLAYDGQRVSLLECNGQTPTSLIEASLAQWHWLEDRVKAGLLPESSDQWNSIHEMITERWKAQADESGPVHFAAGNNSEDLATLTYLQDLAAQAGLNTERVAVRDIGVSDRRDHLIDLRGQEIRRLMWLWPFEFAWEEPAAAALASTRTRFIEPLWKAALSSKGLLALLAERYPAHEAVLPASLTHGEIGGEYVSKPLYSREGQNVTLTGPDALSTPGHYGDLSTVLQRYARLPTFKNERGQPRYPVLGVWAAGDTVCGMGVRESGTRVTDDRASFVPHYIRNQK